MISTKKTLYKVTQAIDSIKTSISAITLASLGIHISTSAPTSADGSDGDIWIQYEN